MSEYKPICSHCGQVHFSDTEFDTQKEANDFAKLKCKCPEAQDWQEDTKRQKERTKRLAAAEESIDNLYEFCKNRGKTLPEEMKPHMLECAALVYDDKINQAVLQFSKFKIAIKINQKGIIAFACSFTDTVKMEQ